jgi:integrase
MITFTSAFAADINAMLEWREALGYSRAALTHPMLSFDRFCATRHPGESLLTRELATAWCQEGLRVDWPVYKAHAIRAFGKYLQLTGVDAFVLPAEWIGSRARSLPHIFTDAELATFFTAADSITPYPTSPFREYTIPVLFRLLLGCGLRPQEARLLRRRDVDTETAVLTIEPEQSARQVRRAGRPAPPGPGVLLRKPTRRALPGSLADGVLPPVPRSGRGHRPRLNALHAAAQLRDPHPRAVGRGRPRVERLAALPVRLHGPQHLFVDRLLRSSAS